MTIVITVIIIILPVIIIITINNINNKDNVNKNQVIWLKKCFLRLCLKVFKLLAFFNVSGIRFQNEVPMKDKAFWLLLVLRKGGCLSFKKLFLKLILASGTYSGPLINLNTVEITDCSNLLLTGDQFKSLNSLWELVDILSNWRQKGIHLFCIIGSFFFSFFC